MKARDERPGSGVEGAFARAELRTGTRAAGQDGAGPGPAGRRRASASPRSGTC